MSKTLILGAILDYGVEQLRPFACSLKHSGLNSETVLLTARVSEVTRSQLAEFGIQTVPIVYRGQSSINSWSRFWPKIRRFPGILSLLEPVARLCFGFATARFFHYAHFLRGRALDYDLIFLTDVRDVRFQSRPFEALPENGIVAFEEAEHMTIRESEPNRTWITSAYGPQALTELGDRRVLCSGTILVSKAGFRHYMQAFRQATRLARCVWDAGIDQAIHNYACRLLIPDRVAIRANSEGPICTLGYMPRAQFRFDSDGRLLDVFGRPYTVLHQYDRHPELCQRWRQTLTQVK